MEGVEEKGREKEECPQAAAAEDDTAAAEEDRPWKMVVLGDPRHNSVVPAASNTFLLQRSCSRD